MTRQVSPYSTNKEKPPRLRGLLFGAAQKKERIQQIFENAPLSEHPGTGFVKVLCLDS